MFFYPCFGLFIYINLFIFLGLGTLSSGGAVPDILQHVEVGYVGQSQCNEDYSGDITPSMMCAADPGQDSCQGDSGGPLYDEENNAVVGIVSWGIGCADPDFPGGTYKIYLLDVV